jgi:tRNA(Arg) A34 adenosine deaminase TadA
MTIHNEILRECFELAGQAKRRGDGPFGSVILDGEGKTIARAGNTTSSDSTVVHHAEINAIKQAEVVRGKGNLSGCVLYTSAEPCPMCAAAIAWSGIDTVIFSVSIEALTEAGMDQIDLKCSEVFGRSGREIALHGPVMEKEGLRVFS